MQIKCKLDNPWSSIITQHFERRFHKATTVSKTNLLEILTDLVIGTKEHRYGPIPPPEFLVVIRDTIRKSIEQDAQIPVLVPWGGRKMTPSLSLDVAELSGLSQIIALDEEIRKFYQPGLHVHMRIEDLNAEWLYKSSQGIEDYSSSMQDLIIMLKGNTHIEGIRESDMMLKSQYFHVSEDYGYLLDAVLTKQIAYPDIDVDSIKEYRELKEKGWKGVIPAEQRNYYLDRYKSLYPDDKPEAHINMLSDYFAGSKARYDLNGRGEPDSSVGSFIQLNFAHPVPGAPATIFNNTVYRRTVPLSQGRTHIAPWRSKGYLKIDGKTNEVSTKITHSSDPVIDELEPYLLELVDEQLRRETIVQSDYLITA